MKSLEGMGKPWLSVSIKDCRVDTFRAGGPGGQRQNKVSSGVRITHEPSGAVGEARDERSQLQNKKLAFRRMVNDPKFALWIRRKSGYEAKAQEWVSKMMDEKYIKTEVHDEKGRWVDMVEES